MPTALAISTLGVPTLESAFTFARSFSDGSCCFLAISHPLHFIIGASICLAVFRVLATPLLNKASALIFVGLVITPVALLLTVNADRFRLVLILTAANAAWFG